MIDWDIREFDTLAELQEFLNTSSEEYMSEPVQPEKVKTLFQDKNTGKYVVVVVRDKFYYDY